MILDFFFSMIFLYKRIASDKTPRSIASHLGLCRLPLSHKQDAGAITGIFYKAYRTHSLSYSHYKTDLNPNLSLAM